MQKGGTVIVAKNVKVIDIAPEKYQKEGQAYPVVYSLFDRVNNKNIFVARLGVKYITISYDEDAALKAAKLVAKERGVEKIARIVDKCNSR